MISHPGAPNGLRTLLLADDPGARRVRAAGARRGGADYIHAARESEGVAVMLRMMEHAEHPPFAPPFLKDGETVIGQTAAILLYLGARHGLAPKDPAGGLWTHQIQLTLGDAVAEAHDTHHPVGA